MSNSVEISSETGYPTISTYGINITSPVSETTFEIVRFEFYSSHERPGA